MATLCQPPCTGSAQLRLARVAELLPIDDERLGRHEHSDEMDILVCPVMPPVVRAALHNNVAGLELTHAPVVQLELEFA